PPLLGVRVTVKVVITSSSFTGSGVLSSSFEHDTNNTVAKIAVAKNFKFLIVSDFKKLIIDFKIK
ncbi:MAG: hypothetical protein ACI917_001031, partial [Patiriisocius sp.]